MFAGSYISIDVNFVEITFVDGCWSVKNENIEHHECYRTYVRTVGLSDSTVSSIYRNDL